MRDRWPRWLLPALLVSGVAVLIAIVAWPEGEGGATAGGRARAEVGKRLQAVPELAATTGQRSSGRRGFLIAQLTAPTALRASPAGRPVARLATRTEFGSQRVLAVVRRKGSWLGVIAPELANGQVGWVDRADARLSRLAAAVRVDVSERTLTFSRGGRVALRAAVGVGRPAAPTPVGRFAVTDKLRIIGSTPYGCCAIALTGHQPNVVQGWTGGDRLAIHGTRSSTSIGRASSLGCLRARSDDLRWLLKELVLGTPVFIRP